MKLPRVELCSLFSSTTSNILFKQLMSVAHDSAPGLIHECPYAVSRKKKIVFLKRFAILQELEVKQKSVRNGTVISIFPTNRVHSFS